MKTKTIPYNANDYLKDPQHQADHLTELWASGDKNAFLLGLGSVIEVYGYSVVAANSGISRQHLYRIVAGVSSTKLETLRSILKALPLSLSLSLVSQMEAA